MMELAAIVAAKKNEFASRKEDACGVPSSQDGFDACLLILDERSFVLQHFNINLGILFLFLLFLVPLDSLFFHGVNLYLKPLDQYREEGDLKQKRIPGQLSKPVATGCPYSVVAAEKDRMIAPSGNSNDTWG